MPSLKAVMEHGGGEVATSTTTTSHHELVISLMRGKLERSAKAEEKVEEVMGVACPSSSLRSRAIASSLMRPEERWVVFVGPYEHHSNLLSWRRSLAGDVVEIGADDQGMVDVEALRKALGSPEYAHRPMLGSFSACSNVTGIVTDTRELARVLHQHGAFACFDFAARYAT
ncbi:hypothetical protein PR202_gb16192 [Eleusine coracana subsp. coracana]|uniref:Aminotransferase class V domain-containing protein n=1 Tax=Eleusine coracana subsp. coracana TaxID=191504 RepID=A0AAV5EXG8_ELECO|nr:hypothetical protein PR202_gb16192 [Eleusine coracana subsp. coracana]